VGLGNPHVQTILPSDDRCEGGGTLRITSLLGFSPDSHSLHSQCFLKSSITTYFCSPLCVKKCKHLILSTKIPLVPATRKKRKSLKQSPAENTPLPQLGVQVGVNAVTSPSPPQLGGSASTPAPPPPPPPLPPPYLGSKPSHKKRGRSSSKGKKKGKDKAPETAKALSYKLKYIYFVA
jgi:hypothetical protein